MTTHFIPNNLRNHRNRAKLRQLDVAKSLGFKSTDRISRWEKGLTFPHIINLFKLSRLYGVAPQDLFASVDKYTENSPAPDTSHPIPEAVSLQ